ncbi:hypothetical protein GCM10009785_34920 [Brooklawnia cerclae]|uniref:Phage portal protein n=1 Tax=Brooklawnia cerclae TaxID=349934 RepID=A0ABX0SNX1_9ACTN|nr:hypothetical protein [Brooklawnia cerclae]NIH58481.1 hypothetical protein [Brooklawnia cerclae]
MSRDDLPAIIESWISQQPHYDLFTRYYEGRHAFPFASWKFRQRYRWITERARMNLMPATVSAFTDRISIDSWTSQDGIDEAEANAIERLAGMVHRGAWRDGDAFTITWQLPNGKLRAARQPANAIVPHVDPDNQEVLDRAARVWVDSTTRHARVNIYYADRCERYISRLPVVEKDGAKLRDIPKVAIGWMPYDGDDGGPVLTHGFGVVPVVWWKRDSDDPDKRGRSILERVIQTQDELNYYVASTIVASERIALPIRYALADSVGLNGEMSAEFDPTKESILALVAKTAGEFPGPDSDKLLALRAAAQQDICLATGIPPYVFSKNRGDVPSGVALRIINESRTSAVRTFEADATPCWRGQMELLGHPGMRPIWDDPTPHDASEQLTQAQAEKDLGMPPEIWLRTAGYDPAATDEGGVSLADRVRAEAASSATAMAQAFLDGQGAAGASYTG